MFHMLLGEVQRKRRIADRGGGSQIVIPLTFRNDRNMIIELLQRFPESSQFYFKLAILILGMIVSTARATRRKHLLAHLSDYIIV